MPPTEVQTGDGLTETEQEADRNAEVARADLAQQRMPGEPIKHIRIKKEAPPVAGGHVLTERGWEPAAVHEARNEQE